MSFEKRKKIDKHWWLRFGHHADQEHLAEKAATIRNGGFFGGQPEVEESPEKTLNADPKIGAWENLPSETLLFSSPKSEKHASTFNEEEQQGHQNAEKGARSKESSEEAEGSEDSFAAQAQRDVLGTVAPSKKKSGAVKKAPARRSSGSSSSSASSSYSDSDEDFKKVREESEEEPEKRDNASKPVKRTISRSVTRTKSFGENAPSPTTREIATTHAPSTRGVEVGVNTDASMSGFAPGEVKVS